MMFSTLHDTAVQLQTAATSTSLYGTLLLETEYDTYIGVTSSICHCTYFKKDFNLDLFREGFGSVVYHVHINYIKHAPPSDYNGQRQEMIKHQWCIMIYARKASMTVVFYPMNHHYIHIWYDMPTRMWQKMSEPQIVSFQRPRTLVWWPYIETISLQCEPL